MPSECYTQSDKTNSCVHRACSNIRSVSNCDCYNCRLPLLFPQTTSTRGVSMSTKDDKQSYAARFQPEREATAGGEVGRGGTRGSGCKYLAVPRYHVTPCELSDIMDETGVSVVVVAGIFCDCCHYSLVVGTDRDTCGCFVGHWSYPWNSLFLADC